MPQFVRCFDPHPDHPYVPYEEPQGLEDKSSSMPDTKTPKLGLTTFSRKGISSGSTSPAIAAWNARNENTVPCGIAKTINVPHPIDFVWKVISAANYWAYWLDWGGYIRRHAEGKSNQRTRISEREAKSYFENTASNIYPGEDIMLSGLNLGTTIACEQGRSFTLSYSRPGRFIESSLRPDIIFIEISAKQKIDSSTDVSISLTQYNKYNRLDLTFRRQAIEENAASAAASDEHLTRDISTNLRNLIDDLSGFGHPVGDYNEKEQPFAWYDWHYGDGTLRFLADQDGRSLVHEGAVLKEGQRVGFVRTSQFSSDEQAFEQNYLQIYRDCTVMRTLKGDGDAIRAGDRIFLFG